MITAITPTRDRPEAFALCEKYMARQTYLGPMQWIVVDDGDKPIVPTLGQTYIRRPTSGSSNTLAPNLLEAIKHIDPSSEAILFFEDDDWYDARYVEQITGPGNRFEIVGLGCHRYYNVYSRKFKIYDNTQFAGLCVTMIRRSLIPWLVQCCEGAIRDNDPWVDLRLWCANPVYPHRDLNKLVIPNFGFSVGIKGMPGRRGLGSGHGVNDPPEFLTHFDRGGELLCLWTGDDAVSYLPFGREDLPRVPVKRPAPFLTISIVVKNQLEQLRKLLTALFAACLSHADRTEIIVTDNGGADGTLQFLTVAQTPSHGLPSIRFVRNNETKNVKVCHKNTKGIAIGGKFIEIGEDLVIPKNFADALNT
jgi:glycosyltransferase involved in cell wall biosynthesis